MTAVLGPLAVDAADPPRVQAFWAAALGASAQRRLLRFGLQEQPKRVKNRVHLDVRIDDPARLLTLGARPVADHRPGWVTLADPEGNEFCAFPATDHDAGTPAAAFAVCTDSDQPEELAAWWAELIGARIGTGPDGTPRWLHGGAGWEDLIWKFVRVGDEKVTPNRWRPTVDATAAALLAAGARPAGAGRWCDPAGNEFSAAHPASSAG